MSTLKTSVVVVLLLAVLYGVYVVLNEPEPQPPAEIGWQEDLAMTPPQIEFGVPATAQPSSEPAGSPPPSAPHSAPPAAPSPGGSVYTPPAPPPSALGLPEPLAPPETLSSPSTVARSNSNSDPNPQPGPNSASSSSSGRERAASLPAAQVGDGGPFVPPAEAENRKEKAAVANLADNVGPSPTPSAPEKDSKDSAAERLVVRAFEKARRSAQSQIERGQFHDALFTLSIFYNSPDLSESERQQLADQLDPLAARVIYSREHYLEPAHRVGREETLMDIAKQYNVPWQLLRNINGIRDPQVLVPGSELKVVRGPFRAEVDLTKGELTVFLGRLYAGRFPISTGADPAPLAGDYQVRDKRTDRAYYNRNGASLPANHPSNPYGRAWLDLGGDVCIHGAPPSGSPAGSAQGCIGLSPIDADDVYGILSQGSKVVVRR